MPAFEDGGSTITSSFSVDTKINAYSPIVPSRGLNDDLCSVFVLPNHCEKGGVTHATRVERSSKMELSTAYNNLSNINQQKVASLLNIWNSLPEEGRETADALINATDSLDRLSKDCKNYPHIVSSLPKAPANVFLLKDKQTDDTCGWHNVFHKRISYDVRLCPFLLHPRSQTLATYLMPEATISRRFLVIDETVQRLYGDRIISYFERSGVNVIHSIVIPGEEENKRMEAVDKILEECCKFGLLRREPIIAIGGGVVLDIAGFAANIYRRGVPYIRVPTTLLAIVDASVGVKNGVDYCSHSLGPQKNRIGSFYAPAAAFLDTAFIATQDKRDVINGIGEILKLALVRSKELFCMLEDHGQRLVEERFQGSDDIAEQVIRISIQIMMEELGPNLWEGNLERCVDYGHTFSKIIEMEPDADIMHGEAVNVDGWLCVILAEQRGMIDKRTKQRIFECMSKIGLPLCHRSVTPDKMHQALLDAAEHRNGKQRIPLITSIGSSVCVNGITHEELQAACKEVWSYENRN